MKFLHQKVDEVRGIIEHYMCEYIFFLPSEEAGCAWHSRCDELELGLPLPQLPVQDFGAEVSCWAPQHPVPPWEERAEPTSPQSLGEPKMPAEPLKLGQLQVAGQLCAQGFRALQIVEELILMFFTHFALTTSSSPWFLCLAPAALKGSICVTSLIKAIRFAKPQSSPFWLASFYQ